MDTPRWLVILSVIFCMISVLTILHRSALPTPISHRDTHENASSTNSEVETQNTKISFKSPSPRKHKTNTISYSKPPRQIFEMDTNIDTQTENKKFKTEGQIVN